MPGGTSSERGSIRVQGLAGLFLFLPQPVRPGLLVPLEGPVEQLDPLEPLDVRHPVPARNEQAQRETVLRRQRRAVHLVGQEHVVPQRLVQREAALEPLLLPALDAAVEPGEEHLDRSLAHPRLFEQRSQRGAGPAGGADRLQEPRLADRARIEPRAAVPGALHRRGHLECWAVTKVLEPQRELALACDRETPGRRVDDRHVVVDQQVVQADRRDGKAQRLERHPVVARRELELLEADAFHLRQITRRVWRNVARRGSGAQPAFRQALPRQVRERPPRPRRVRAPRRPARSRPGRAWRRRRPLRCRGPGRTGGRRG